MKWEVLFHPEFDPEYEALAQEVQDELLARLKVLKEMGPQLGRPRVDTLNGSEHSNLKELRFDAGDGVWRFAFAFAPKRRAIVLCGGDKSEGNERKFYRDLIARGDKRFDAEVAPIVWTLGLGGHWFMIASLEFSRTQVTERRVPPLAIVKALDVFEDFTPGLSSGVPLTLVDQFELEGAKKLSATALSQQLPLRLMLLRIP